MREEKGTDTIFLSFIAGFICGGGVVIVILVMSFT